MIVGLFTTSIGGGRLMARTGQLQVVPVHRRGAS